ncbi:MAG TPA: hypothetical protein VH000_00655 [Rhizomicrobium sp.]|jgi:hypothetical protein|nr:hypothetical protein [Rhizomicrobium sp.]
MRKVWIAGAVVAMLIAVTAGCLYMFDQALDTCGNKIVAAVQSPDGALKAVLFERDCGATTGFSSQVSVLANDEMLANEGGNVFAADDNKGAADSAPWRGPMVKLKWRGPRHLEIHYDQFARVHEKNQSANGASIHFVPDL